MTTPTTAELLKYADLQMAAEAFLANDDGSLKADLKKALTEGNKTDRKFNHMSPSIAPWHSPQVAENVLTDTSMTRKSGSGE